MLRDFRNVNAKVGKQQNEEEKREIEKTEAVDTQLIARHSPQTPLCFYLAASTCHVETNSKTKTFNRAKCLLQPASLTHQDFPSPMIFPC
ncbi:hypothetical protein RRG08_007232 [Elysia crispata]|uniref:Uncharacterized protein n=1 Tax=Elysia crispata TaxID=231223 RepID=A0AAE0ZT61_9GAST|nr:hypothetical protein RRG08_007232 [Elysia crispata]